ncbi:MAG: DUF4258 domain-containing protein [Planctomycetia bacterium]|nr:DUF4258 domain-containing protein [Planctomycetia bacterium]
MNLSQAVLTEHALGQMGKRQVTAAEVERVLDAPEQVLEVRAGRVVAQGMAGEYLLRVFVDVDRTPAEVVTVYRTSRIEKYRSEP